jgi:hypothetical protein
VLPKRSKVQRVANHAALPYSRLPQFMTALRQQSEIVARASELPVPTKFAMLRGPSSTSKAGYGPSLRRG